MDEKTERLRKMARDAIKEYGDATAGGSEPIYPAWADDLLEVLDAPVKRHPDVHDNNSVQVGFAPQVAASAEPVAWAFNRPGEQYKFFTTNPEADNLRRDTLVPLYTAPVAAQPIVTEEMVTRFLGWKLPEDFAPDGGISFKPFGLSNGWPVGTNLLTATQAKAMLEYVLQGAFVAAQPAVSAESVGTVRHFQYSGIARRGFSQEAVLNDDAPDLPDGSPLYTAPVAAHPSVPGGWKLVPVDLTDEMAEAAWESHAAEYVGEHKYIHDSSMAWDAMLAAAPTPPADSQNRPSLFHQYIERIHGTPPPAAEQAQQKNCTWANVHPDCAMAQQDADKVDVQPVAWFAFADNNGPVPLELYGWDEKACKHAVLAYARADNWKGTIEGYLLRNGWMLRPVYLATIQPDPAMAGDELSKQLQGLADRAYCQYIEQMRRDECKGVEHKQEDGKFGVVELAAHNKAYEFLGRHRAFSEAAGLLKRVQPASGEDVRDAGRYRYILDCEIKTTLKYLPKLNIEAYKAKRRANHDAAMQQGDR